MTISINFYMEMFDALKTLQTTEVDRRTWLHGLRGLTGPPAVTLTKQLKYKMRLLLRCIHHFKTDFLNNMDYMRISGTKPPSVILSQAKYFQKQERGVPKVSPQAEANRDSVIDPQNYNFNQFYMEHFDALKTLRINRSRPQNLATCALGDSLVYQQ